MVGYSAGVTALDWYAMRYLERHHHPKLGHWLMTIDMAQDAYWATHNLALPLEHGVTAAAQPPQSTGPGPARPIPDVRGGGR
jgi:hypothetical protein